MESGVSIQCSRALIAAIVTCASCVLPTAQAAIYWANPVEAKVVDAQTGAPIEAALVVANWQLEGGLDTGIPRGQIEIQETFTDASGTFRLQGWGPRVRFSGHASWKWPQILIFKPGYRFARLMNEPASGRENTPSSDWNGKQIRLSPLADAAGRLAEYGSFNRQIDAVARTGGDECAWREIPQTLSWLAAEDARLRAAGFHDFSSFAQILRTNAQYFADKGCGPLPSGVEEPRR
jgi:hypothetical protein